MIPSTQELTGATMLALSCFAFLLLGVLVFYACWWFFAQKKAADALREKTQLEAQSLRMVALRQMAYDGCAYAFELAGKAKKAGSSMTGKEKKRAAIDYVLRNFPGASEPLVSDVVDSCLGKVQDGASGRDKI